MGCLDTLGVIAFNVNLLLCTTLSYIIAKVGSFCECCCPLRPGAKRTRLVLWITCICWRLLFALSCWVRVRVDGLDEYRRKLGSSRRPCIIVSNHLSFLDTMLLVPLTPLTKVTRVKMLVSSHLLKMPFLRTIVRMMGHIVVPFKRGADPGSFELDKDLMAIRQQQLEDHVRAGGIAGWFPEGRMNTSDPLEVGMFRAGGFALPVHLDVEIWCVAFVGNSRCWPRTAAAGGRPSQIRARIFRFCDSSWAAAAPANGGPGPEDEKQAAIYLANATHDAIQAAVSVLATEMGEDTRSFVDPPTDSPSSDDSSSEDPSGGPSA